MNKYACTLILGLLFPFSVLCAQPSVRVSAQRMELGTVIWHEPQSAIFEVTNAGQSDLYILQVHPDCGCTSVDWTSEAIRPGEKGVIHVRHDAELLGHFEKQVEVYTNAAVEPFRLTIAGDVALERMNGSGEFPYRIGDLCLHTDNVEFDDVRAGDRPQGFLRIFNAGRQSYTPEMMHLPKYLTARAEPEVIRPGRVGTVFLTLDSEKVRNMGLTQTNIYLSRYPGDRVSRDNEIFISTTLLPETSSLGVKKDMAPVATLDSTSIRLNVPDSKRKAKGMLHLTNTGKSDLEVLALQVYNPGISVSLGKRKLKPGQSGELRITVNPNSDYFKGRRRVLLITNDPVHPKMVIDVRIDSGTDK